ncbi:glutathione S-transferase T3-like [Phragmites australis]|uniref:glutathione S-transferase T3-like n=1 Tax=Phragmites australis TaxID=29695 RepID=UPI002D79012F|nr:glutathione S-transferase T3-like [Phragmites australis]
MQAIDKERRKRRAPSSLPRTQAPIRIPDESEEQQTGNEGLAEQDEDTTTRRFIWADEDNSRLISAWLKKSVDPIRGISSKKECYWKDVAEEYNSNSPEDRRRGPNSCKEHWGKTNRKVVHFNGVWCRLKKVYVNGQSDEQLIEKIRATYKHERDHWFTLDNWWKEVRNQPKWNRTYPEDEKKNKGTKVSNLENNLSSSQDEVHIFGDKVRPLGTKVAKLLAKGKGKEQSGGSMSHENFKLYHESQTLRSSTSLRLAEVQLQLSKDHIEVAQSQERAAKEKKQCKIMDKYTELLMADTSKMNDSQREEHDRALKFFGDNLHGKNN